MSRKVVINNLGPNVVHVGIDEGREPLIEVYGTRVERINPGGLPFLMVYRRTDKLALISLKGAAVVELGNTPAVSQAP
jgi:hypothetical protein